MPFKSRDSKKGIDPTGEIPKNGLNDVVIDFTNEPSRLKECKFIIVAVPTPVDRNKRPDLAPLELSSAMVGKNLSKNSIVVFESTVYPGITEEKCVPILEKNSNLTFLKDFRVGYSPERINPGDTTHRLQNIVKVVSGCDSESLDIIAKIYESIIEAGVYRAPSIKVAEAAKVIENTQRDVNIALMNELSIIFHKLNIDTLEVLKAAGTKWNFLKFYPGLVGGHCIGVAPYYLTYKAEEVGYHPEVILSGRRINDSMGKFVAENTVKKLIKAGKAVKGAKILILGLTFKENVADIRNTKVVDIIHELTDYQVETFFFDPYTDAKEVKEEYQLEILPSLDKAPKVDGVVVAVPHDEFKEISLLKIAELCKPEQRPLLIDLKGIFSIEEAKKNEISYWRL